MGATDILSQAWSLYKAHWQRLVAISLIVAIVVAVLNALLINLDLAGLLLAAVVTTVGYFVVQAALTEATADLRDGRADLSIGGTFGRVAPRLGAVIIVGLLAGIAIGIGFVLLIIPGVLLLTLWVALIPAIVLENRGFDAFSRSQQLTTQNFGLALGVVVLTLLVRIVIGVILGFLTVAFDPVVRQIVNTIVSDGFVTPFIVLSWTLLYFALAQPAGAGPGPGPAGRPPEGGPPVGDR